MVRIVGAYPPPVPSTAAAPDDLAELLARPPRVTRYDRGRPASARRRATRAWTATSAVLAAAGVGAIVLLPHQTSVPVRVAPPPVAVAPAPVPATAPVAPVAASIAPVAELRQLPASEPVRVRIPALGTTSRVMQLGLESDGAMEVPPGA